MNNNYLKHNGIFGAIVGACYISAILIFYLFDKDINFGFNPNLTNAMNLLTILGMFLGVKHYRDKHLGGFINYGQALKTACYIISVGALIKSILLYILYSSDKQLMQDYIEGALDVTKQVYGDNLAKQIESLLPGIMTPGLIAFSHMFNTVFFAFILGLLIAAILKKKDTTTNI